MIEGSCHCGGVRLKVDAAPATVTECNCSICRRYGVLWAYFSPKQVQIDVISRQTDRYSWDDKSIEFHRCANCGCVTHWTAVDPAAERMGINARLLDPQILALARVRHLDGANTEQYLD
jgi:hypothetical protein